jgi:hypothetical protein
MRMLITFRRILKLGVYADKVYFWIARDQLWFPRDRDEIYY